MILERLIGRGKTENIGYGTVESINTFSSRLTVKARNDVAVTVSYSPTEFPNIAVGDVVAIGYRGLDRFLVSRVPAGLPRITILANV